MKLLLLSICIYLLPVGLYAQSIDFSKLSEKIINLGTVTNGNENFSEFERLKPILNDVEIVLIGEQTHTEGTILSTKVKLVKYLHEELGFNLLVFESGLYDCRKAWELIVEGEEVDIALAKSVFGVWSMSEEFIPLAKYIKNEKGTKTEFKVLGFDNQFVNMNSKLYLLDDLKQFIDDVDPSITDTKQWAHFKVSYNYLVELNKKELRKRDIALDTSFVSFIINKIDIGKESSNYWIQVLKSLNSFFKETTYKDETRDKQMAENLIWIKEHYPNEKIICWGATSHFIYNSRSVKTKRWIVRLLGGDYSKMPPMMGSYIKEKYKNKAFMIGFVAYQGEYGFNRAKKIKIPKINTLEHLLGQSKFNNFLLPLNGLNLESYNSRPFGHQYIKSSICNIMDAVIFNRNVERYNMNIDIILKIYPNHKYLKPKSKKTE